MIGNRCADWQKGAGELSDKLKRRKKKSKRTNQNLKIAQTFHKQVWKSYPVTGVAHTVPACTNAAQSLNKMFVHMSKTQWFHSKDTEKKGLTCLFYKWKDSSYTMQTFPHVFIHIFYLPYPN